MSIIEKLGITPRPWEAEEDQDRLSMPFYISHTPETGSIQYVCELGDNCTDNDGSTEYRNAQLISAAPEMLEALIDEQLSMDMCGLPDLPGDIKIKSIIQKATGKSWEEIKELINE